LPEVKVPPKIKNKESRKKEREKENLIDRESSPKSRNVVSLQPSKNEEVELLKRKLKNREIDKPQEESCINNIRVIKPDEHNKSKDQKDIMLPNLPSIKIINNSLQQEENSPKRKYYYIFIYREEIKKKMVMIKKEEEIKLGKLLPYLNNEHISNVYQIYSPYSKVHNNSPIIKKYKNSDNKHSKYLKQIEKYYEYNIYKPKKNIIEQSSPVYGGKIVPNRKLSPLNKKLIKI
jgi:hypothetical protein